MLGKKGKTKIGGTKGKIKKGRKYINWRKVTENKRR